MKKKLIVGASGTALLFGFILLFFTTPAFADPTPIPTLSSTPTATPSPTPTLNPSDWVYRQQGSVTASGVCGNLSNYQMRLVIHKGAGSSTGSDIYLNNHCRDDFGDVRFTNVGSLIFLDYWMEKYTSGVNATVWVEFDQREGAIFDRLNLAQFQVGSFCILSIYGGF